MSELKVHRFITTDELFPEANAGSLYYDKSEADKMIAELKQQIEFLQKEKKIIRDLYIGERDDCRIWSARAINNKYKRCLAMADKCVDLCHKAKDLYRWAEDENLEHYYNHKIEFFARWHKRWLTLADKYKEGNV